MNIRWRTGLVAFLIFIMGAAALSFDTSRQTPSYVKVTQSLTITPAGNARDACTLLKHNPDDSVLGLSSGYEQCNATVTVFDPAECGSPTYPFGITSLEFSLLSFTGWQWPIEIDIVIYDALPGDGSCAGPQAELYRLPVVCNFESFGFPTVGAVIFPDTVCVDRPFFVGIEYTDSGTGLFPSVIFDTETIPDTCDIWQYYCGYWWEWHEFWVELPGYPFFWVNGETYCTACCDDPDEDGLCSADDNCPVTPNPDQDDSDLDGIGDICDTCPQDPYDDADGDGLCADIDNCDGIYNPLQEDNNFNGIGDVCENCCTGITGNVNFDGLDAVDISDLTYLVDYLFGGGPPPPCINEANLDGSPEADPVNISDLTYMVEYLFAGGPSPVACP
jgi:hypothetical protein